jgi:hypothetical protein
MDVTLDGTIEQMRKKLADTGALPGLAVLDADSAIGEIRSKTEGLPVAHVYLWASVGGMDDDLVERHLDLVATRVVPALHGDAT